MTEEKKKPGPKAKPDPLLARIERLEALVCKFAALCGQRNLPIEFDPEGKELTPWDPGKKDLTKY